MTPEDVQDVVLVVQKLRALRAALLDERLVSEARGASPRAVAAQEVVIIAIQRLESDLEQILVR